MDIGKPLGTKSPASEQLGNSSGDPELACRAVVSRTPSRRQIHRQTRAGKCSRAPDAVKPKVGVVRFTGEGTRLMKTFAKRKEIGASLGGRLGVSRGRERAAGRVFQAEGTACAKARRGALSLRQRNDRGGRWRQDGRALPVLLKGLDFVQWEPLRGIKQSSNMTVCISLLAPQSSDSYPNTLAGFQRLTNSRCQHTNGWIPLMSLLLSLEYTPQCRACPGYACPLGWSYSRRRPGSRLPPYWPSLGLGMAPKLGVALQAFAEAVLSTWALSPHSPPHAAPTLPLAWPPLIRKVLVTILPLGETFLSTQSEESPSHMTLSSFVAFNLICHCTIAVCLESVSCTKLYREAVAFVFHSVSGVRHRVWHRFHDYLVKE